MIKRIWSLFEKLVRAVVGFFLKIVHKELSEEQWQALMQFIKFCLVGVLNSLVSTIVYYIFIIINKKLYLIGNAGGFVVGILNSYLWNSKFVFKKTDEKGKRLLKTCLAYALNLAISSALLCLFIDAWHISEYIAPFLNLVVTVPLNFVLNKFWVMK